MNKDKLIEQLKEMGAEVDDLLDKILPPEDTYPEELHRAMRYSVFAGGKRLRPFLVLQGAAVGGLHYRQALPLAAGAELIHVSSLVHDDLPCMDDDDLRRGKPTNHKVFGEAMALLCGDALIMLGFDIAAANAEIEGVETARALAALRELHCGVGYAGMLSGQAIDIAFTASTATTETLDYIHRHKTGSFITHALRAGAVLAGLAGEDLDALTGYGNDMGLAFQITDDILDIVGDPVLLGKSIGSDQRQDKATYPSLYGLDQARRRVVDLAESGHAHLERFGMPAGSLHALLDYIIERDR
ncbi:MAG: polyprenyl synthetase family protein [bacterium]|nr:polyprenyl synthetase family protein [bacterium]MDD3805452.1 polyprenyl synthetase family protein [bacterium]MDD4152354.1 polyprenyl synthetase family protein [bacterium]MDD4557977.1 polyprenyl synthetase family protein [bacterium]